MRTNQNKRMRGRNRKSQNPLSRVYESNGPDVKIRGSATHIAEKYVQLARDAQTSSDPVAAENYYQHAEHYFRLIASAQEQYRQNPPFYRPEGDGRSDESYDDGDDDGAGSMEPGYAANDPQPYLPRETQPFVPRDAQSYQQREPQPSYPARDVQPHYSRQPAVPAGNADTPPEVDRLPSFITGSAPAAHQANGQNGGTEPSPQQQPERYPLHRRRRRHRGPRSDTAVAQGGEDARPPTND